MNQIELMRLISYNLEDLYENNKTPQVVPAPVPEESKKKKEKQKELQQMEMLNRIDKALRNRGQKDQLQFTLDELTRDISKEQRQEILGERLESKLDKMDLENLDKVYEEVHRKVLIQIMN